MSKRVAIYARVSTDGQTTENQLRELRQVAERHGWDVVAEYVDHGISGAKGRDQRPALDDALKAACKREYEQLLAWSVDRLGRSLQNLVELLSELQAKKVDLYLHTQALDTSTPSGRAMFGMLGVFSEFERSIIQARVKAGLDRARAKGKTLGRPKAKLAVERRILEERAKGTGKRRIAQQLGIGTSVVQRVLREAEAAQ